MNSILELKQYLSKLICLSEDKEFIISVNKVLEHLKELKYCYYTKSDAKILRDIKLVLDKIFDDKEVKECYEISPYIFYINKCNENVSRCLSNDF